MSRRFVFGNTGGLISLRTARPGYDAGDPSLDPRYLSFDSQWRNGLRLAANGRVATSGLASGIWYPGPASSFMPYQDIPIPGGAGNRAAMVWQQWGAGTYNYIPDGGPSDNLVSLAYARRYRNVQSIIRSGAIRVQQGGDNLVYYLFDVPTFEGDPTEDGGGNGAVYGNHSTLGPGFFISRRGTDPLTCPESDLILTTRRNHFQICEIGQASAHYWQPTSENMVRRVRVTLSGWYPHYPPVVAFAAGPMVYSSGEQNTQWVNVYWLSPNEIMLDGDYRTQHDFTIRYAVVATDPEYQGGVDSASTLRCLANPALGFGVTKHNVHADYAGEWDWIFRADRMSLHVMSNGFAPITTGRPEGINTLPVASTSGMSISFYLMYSAGIDGLFCGVGGVSPYCIRLGDPFGVWIPARWWGAATVNASQYAWWRNDGSGLHTGGLVCVCNVADF